MSNGDTVKLERLRIEILGDLKEIKSDAKDTLKIAHENKVAIAGMNQHLIGLNGRVATNAKDIDEVRGWFFKILLSAAGSGGFTGAVAALLLKMTGG